jgi:hypothetical protein
MEEAIFELFSKAKFLERHAGNRGSAPWRATTDFSLPVDSTPPNFVFLPT